MNVTIAGSSNAKVLLRFYLEDGSSFDVVYWQSPAVLNAVLFDLDPYAGRTLSGLAYVALMSLDGTTANINMTQITFEAALSYHILVRVKQEWGPAQSARNYLL